MTYFEINIKLGLLNEYIVCLGASYSKTTRFGPFQKPGEGEITTRGHPPPRASLIMITDSMFSLPNPKTKKQLNKISTFYNIDSSDFGEK